MSAKHIELWECVCEKCGHGWVTRSPDLPKVCSNCKRENWNEAKEPERGIVDVDIA